MATNIIHDSFLWGQQSWHLPTTCIVQFGTFTEGSTSIFCGKSEVQQELHRNKLQKVNACPSPCETRGWNMQGKCVVVWEAHWSSVPLGLDAEQRTCLAVSACFTSRVFVEAECKIIFLGGSSRKKKDEMRRIPVKSCCVSLFTKTAVVARASVPRYPPSLWAGNLWECTKMLALDQLFQVVGDLFRMGFMKHFTWVSRWCFNKGACQRRSRTRLRHNSFVCWAKAFFAKILDLWY